MKARFYHIDDIARIEVKLDDGSHHDYEFISESMKQEIYEKIHRKDAIRLDGVFINEFSASEYKRKFGIQEHELIQISIDFVTNCCFAGRNTKALDLSWVELIADDKTTGIMLDNCIFLNGDVDFSYSTIDDSEFSMRDCGLYKSTANFNFTQIGSKNFYFNRVDFYNTSCDVLFRGTVFENAEDIDISECKNNKGTFEFYRCDFGSSSIDFTNIECPDSDFIFFEIETSSQPWTFTDSIINKIVMYKVNTNGLLDLRIGKANYITIQESVIRDTVWLGNKGYKNFTSYCLKESSILGHIRIMNPLSSKLFKNQLQLSYDPKEDDIILCETSFSDKAKQLLILSQNFLDIGDTKSADITYVLSKRFYSRGRIQDVWYDIGSIKRTYPTRAEFLKRSIIYIALCVRLLLATLSSFIEFLVLDLFCGEYATKPGKFFTWMLAIIAIFAAAFSHLIDYKTIIILADNIVRQSSYLAALIFSVRVFFQFDSFSNASFSGLANSIILIERIVGLIVLSLFAVSYTRKVIK